MKLHDYIGQPWDPTFYWDRLYGIDAHGRYILPAGSRNEKPTP